MTSTRRHLVLLLMVVLVGNWLLPEAAHQDPCHRLHRCPSDQGSYSCGDLGRGEQGPDHQYCLTGKARVASSSPHTPAPSAPSSSTTTPPCAVTVCFTPGGNCTDAIVQALGDAKRTIRVQAYSFTSAPIAKALLGAHKHGLQVILDKSQRTERYSSADFLANQGVPTMIDANHAISHNKVIVIDAEFVITGSFNFTKAAQQKNAENVIIIRDTVLAEQYTANWLAHAQHSQPYVGRGVRQGWRRGCDTGDASCWYG
jgi:phosphatidylserine/phosphatidylglycerophosphate/cardiolipin synthase-like enzyme